MTETYAELKRRLPTHGGEDGGTGHTADELEFLRAVERFKKDHGVRFPTVSQYLHVARGLGYVRPALT